MWITNQGWVEEVLPRMAHSPGLLFAAGLAGVAIALGLAVREFRPTKPYAASRWRVINRRTITQQRGPEARNLKQWIGVATAVVAAVGALVFNAYSVDATRAQISVAERGQITERFSRASEQLGSAKLEVRLGAVYSLERVMKDSPEDRGAIRKLLAGFIREQSPRRADDGRRAPRFRTDLQAALSVITEHAETIEQRLADEAVDLRDTDLRRTDLRGSWLQGAELARTDLRQADMENAYLAQASLEGADLSSATMRQADLRNASLSRTTSRSGGPLPPDAHELADLANTDLRGALLDGANLRILDLRFSLVGKDDLTGANLGGAKLPISRHHPPELSGPPG